MALTGDPVADAFGVLAGGVASGILAALGPDASQDFSDMSQLGASVLMPSFHLC